MAKNKTTETEESVTDFLNKIADEAIRTDSFRIAAIMEEETGYPAKMWGSAIVGYGSYNYKYESGHEGDAPLAGFSPRAKAFSLYLAQSAEDRQPLLQKLGKHKAAVSCVYIKKLADVNEAVLRQMIKSSVKHLKGKYQ